MKSVTIKSSNNQTTTVTANDNATVQQILQTTGAVTFFGKSHTEITNAFSGLNGQPVSPAISQYMLQASPNSGDVIEINLAVNGLGTQAQASAVPGTVIVKWNGGAYSVNVSGVAVGTTSVADVVRNPMVASRFGITPAQLSACEITYQTANGSDLGRLTQSAAATTMVGNGDTIWLQSRSADDKGHKGC